MVCDISQRDCFGMSMPVLCGADEIGKCQFLPTAVARYLSKRERSVGPWLTSSGEAWSSSTSSWIRKRTVATTMRRITLVNTETTVYLGNRKPKNRLDMLDEIIGECVAASTGKIPNPKNPLKHVSRITNSEPILVRASTIPTQFQNQKSSDQLAPLEQIRFHPHLLSSPPNLGP